MQAYSCLRGLEFDRTEDASVHQVQTPDAQDGAKLGVAYEVPPLSLVGKGELDAVRRQGTRVATRQRLSGKRAALLSRR
jgi:hypothetical protein